MVLMQIVVFDTEYTTWEGAQDRRWLGENEYKEIIEIAAIKAIVQDVEVAEEFTLLIRPKKNPVLSEYCKSLTGISQEQIDQEGVDFQSALQKFLDFCDRHPVISYGNDAGIIAENIILNRADPLTFYGSKSPSFINIKHWIRAYDEKASTANSGNLWRSFGGLPPKKFEREHHPLSDCYSILQAIKHMQEKGFHLPFETK